MVLSFAGNAELKLEKPETEKENTRKPAAKKKPKDGESFSPKAKKIIIAQIIVLAVLIAAFIYLGTRNSKPESAANQFVKNYNDKNWSKVYDAYHFEEDTFINEDTFKATMDQSDTETLPARWEDISAMVSMFIESGKDPVILPSR